MFLNQYLCFINHQNLEVQERRSLVSQGTLTTGYTHTAVRETVYRRRPGLPSRQTHHLEQPAGQRDIRQRLKTFLFQASFPNIIIDPR